MFLRQYAGKLFVSRRPGKVTKPVVSEDFHLSASKVLQKFCELVNIVLDTSQKFGIISHTENSGSIEKLGSYLLAGQNKVLVSKGRGLIFIRKPRGFISPAKTHRLVHGIGHK